MLAAGWVLAVIAILQIPIWGVLVVRKQEGSTWIQVRIRKISISKNVYQAKIRLLNLQRFKASLRPAFEWGPKNAAIKRDWLDYNKQPVRFSWIPNPKWHRSCKSH